MIDNYNPDIFEQLKLEVENLVGRPIKTPKDFEFLSCQIEGYTRETISVSTLKRMWGYVVSNCKPSKYNLNLLSRMVGYPDWSSFVGGQEGLSSSRFFVKSKLIADALQKGELVKLTWCPGRVLTIMYKGNDMSACERGNETTGVGAHVARDRLHREYRLLHATHVLEVAHEERPLVLRRLYVSLAPFSDLCDTASCGSARRRCASPESAPSRAPPSPRSGRSRSWDERPTDHPHLALRAGLADARHLLLLLLLRRRVVQDLHLVHRAAVAEGARELLRGDAARQVVYEHLVERRGGGQRVWRVGGEREHPPAPLHRRGVRLQQVGEVCV